MQTISIGLLCIASGLIMGDKKAKQPPKLTPEQRRAIAEIERLGGGVEYDVRADFDVVESVHLWNSRFSDADLHLFDPFRDYPLFSIGFGRSRLTEAGVKNLLQRFPNLGSVDLGGVPVDASVCDALSRLKKLEMLTIRRNLALRGGCTMDTVYAAAGKLRNVWDLDLDDSTVDDRGLERLKGLSKMKWLGLANSKVTDKGLKTVAGFRHLEMLFLHGTQVGDDGLKWLSGLEKLESLRLGDTRVTGAGLIHLKALKSLKDVELGNTAITRADLDHLKDHPRLERVSVEGTGIDRDTRIRFEMALPANEKDVKRGMRTHMREEPEDWQRFVRSLRPHEHRLRRYVEEVRSGE